MTEEQLNKAAEDYQKEFLKRGGIIKKFGACSKDFKEGYCAALDDYASDIFKEGAEWMQKQSPWISVKDRLPDYDEQVMVYNPDCGVFFNHRSDNPDVQTDSNGWCVLSLGDNITHWMPIPELPTSKTE